MFPNAVMRGKIRAIWNVRVTQARTIAFGGAFSMGQPSKRMEPESSG